MWIQSHEHEDALTEIAQMCRDQQWRLATWDIDQGLKIPGQGETPADAGGTDPLAQDTDGDGLTDFEEVATHGTDPLDADTDRKSVV